MYEAIVKGGIHARGQATRLLPNVYQGSFNPLINVECRNGSATAGRNELRWSQHDMQNTVVSVASE